MTRDASFGPVIVVATFPLPLRLPAAAAALVMFPLRRRVPVRLSCSRVVVFWAHNRRHHLLIACIP